ncbi:D-alanine--D-alanine ligase [Robiginitalea marina]|uniref:D-alanine--D-alanine ligase n=1 Tax=Robiginitalea marina TaxID=2954105 RepID=A0ABT1AYW6_9FLAO|nr:D-alanine--D-alanine ligase [Robiginitalea marina]MCO5724874.1 D-alanine--D-alanine ligase [Robiginitalea marina]
MRKKIAIVMGGYSSEYPISIKSGNAVYNSLDRNHYEPYRVVIEPGKWVVLGENGQEYPVDRHDFSARPDGQHLHFDCVFNAIHGTPGEDGLLAAYFELLGIPFTSCGSYQAALTFNKRDLLSVLKPRGVHCATSYLLDRGQEIRPQEIFARVGLPCFVKANRAGSSFGVTLVKNPDGLDQALEAAFREDDEVLIESALKGTEVSVGVIRLGGEVKVLPITEIVPDNEFFDYEAKYLGKSQEITPARLDPRTRETVEKTARFIYETLKMKGFSRSEFILVEGVPHFLEMNTTPGLTEASILPQQAQAAGISLQELFGGAIGDALDKKP